MVNAAQTIPVFVVSGVVKDAKGNPVGAGVVVQAKNENRPLITATGTTNAAGQYVVTFVAMEGEKIAAEVGDTISVMAQDTTVERKLTEEDISVAHVSIDIQPPDKLNFAKIGDQVADATKRLLFEVNEGKELRLTLVAHGGKGKQLTYTASPLPDGASVKGDVFAWLPGYDTVTREEGQKDFDMTLSVTNEVGEQVSQSIKIKVYHTSNADKLTVSVSPKELAAIPGSTANIEVTVIDVQEKPVTDELVTLILSPQVGTLSNVENQGDGVYKATYTAGVELGEVTITASTTNDKQGSDSLKLIEGPSKELQLTIEPSELIACPGKYASIEVKVYDVAKHPLKGKQVSLSLSPQTGALSSITDKGNGAYTATYTAGETAGIVTLTAKVDNITQEKEITLKPCEISGFVEVTSPIEAGQTATIKVTLRDIEDNPVIKRNVRISIEGIDKPIEIETAPTDAQGQTQATTEKFTKAGPYMITTYALPNGPAFEKKELIVRPGPSDKIEIVVPPKTETETEVVLTMSVYDKYGNPISDATVNMKTDLGTVTSPAQVKGEGKYTATFSSGAKEGTAKITASIEGGPSKTAEVVVYKYPRIKSGDIKADNPINPLWGKAGTTFTITAKANVSGKMTFSIGDIPGIQNHPMQEVSTGNYEGTYTVPTGVVIEAPDAPVKLRLEDDFGNLAELTLEKHVAIDNVSPPAPDLQVEGGGIYLANLSKVVVKAKATPGRTVVLKVKEIDGSIARDTNENIIEEEDFSKTAEPDGQITWTLDATNWTAEKTKDYLLEAAEEPDKVGNPGETKSLVVTRSTIPKPLFFVDLPPNITYCIDVGFKVTLVFPESPPESVPASAEADITLIPPIGEEREFNLPLLPDEPGSLRLLGSLNLLVDAPGKWEYKLYWPGNEKHPFAERTGSFEVGPGEAELSLKKDVDNVKPGQEILFSGQLKFPCQPTPDELKNQPIKIKMQMQKPEVGAWEYIVDESKKPVGYSTSSQGYFEARFIPDTDGVWQFRVVWDGLKDKEGRQLYKLAVSPIIEVTVIFPSGKVVIAVGGNSSESYWKKTFLKLGKHVYDVFSRRGFPAENIRFLSPAPTEAPTDTLISRDALKDAILNWGAKDMGPNENLYLYLLSDNLKDSGFILQSGVHGVDRLDKSDVHEWLKELSARKVNLVLVLESCYSGEYIQNAPVKTTDARRVFITSADARTQADIIRTDSFTQRFFNRLDRRENFKSAFEETKKEMSFVLRNVPQVDATGDSIPNDLEDLKALDGLFLGDPRIQAGDAPNITNWSVPQILAKGKHEATIEAFIKGGGVKASAVIFPPGHRDVAEVKSWEELEGITVELVGDENTGYRAAYDGFTEPGEYTILITAENIDGTAIPARTTVTVPGSLLGDVNGDGKVNSKDASLALRIAVGLIEPTAEQILAADMNGDGKIKANDVSAILRKAVGAGAPALVSSHAEKAVKISLSKVEYVADDNVRVQLTVDKPSAIGSADIIIAYDPAILTATNVETPQNALWVVNLNSPGQIRLATANLEVSTESMLATIYFKPNFSFKKKSLIKRNTKEFFLLLVLQAQKSSRISERKTCLELQETEVFGFDTLPLTVTKVNGEFTSPLIAPDRNLLGQNFPNPFNPETWIPFELAKPADVTIHIFDQHGRKVRSLSLGRKDAGMYMRRDRAAYWDGKNDSGEKVASGVYFYVLKAGQFQAVRKLCVVK
jgi:hypothetical protein